jgi:phosphoserine phosphatase
VGRLWKGKPAKLYYDLIKELEYVKGVEQVFQHLKNKGYKSAIISAGSIDAARRAQKDHGINFIYANELVIKDDKVSGGFNWPIGAGKHKKALIVRQLCIELGITTKQAAYIGDTITDLEAFQEVGLSIAFNTRSEELKKAADHVIDELDLKKIIPYL